MRNPTELARTTVLRLSTAARLRSAVDHVDDPARQILPLQLLRERITRQLLRDPLSPDSRQQAFAALADATSARVFFYGDDRFGLRNYPEQFLYWPIPVTPAEPNTDLASLVAHPRPTGPPPGIVVTGALGSGKTVALWKVWHDCFLSKPALAESALAHTAANQSAQTQSTQAGPRLPFWLPVPRVPRQVLFDEEPRRLILGLIAVEAGLVRSLADFAASPSLQRQLDLYVEHSPRLLILCDLNHATESQRPQLVAALNDFQATYVRQHTCVVADASDGTGLAAAWFQTYTLANIDAATATNYLASYRAYEQAVYVHLCSQVPGLAITSPAHAAGEEETRLNFLIERKPRRLSVPFLMHAVTQIPRHRLPGACNDLLVLFWLAWRRQGGPPRPPTLEHLWNDQRLQEDATCEYLLHQYDRRAVRRWRHFQRHTLAGGGDPGSAAPYIEHHFSRRKEPEQERDPDQASTSANNPSQTNSREGPPFLSDNEASRVTDDNQETWGNLELTRMFQFALDDRRQREPGLAGPGFRLCVTEDANAGKTVFTHRAVCYFASLAADAGRAKFFRNQSVLVVRFDKWPKPTAATPDEVRHAIALSLTNQVAIACGRTLSMLARQGDARRLFAVARNSPATAEEQAAEAVVHYAWRNHRLALVLDALDQEQNDQTKSLIDMLHEDAHLRNCPAIVTGRPFAFDRPEGLALFRPASQTELARHWSLALLRPFSDNQQRRFLHTALPENLRAGDDFKKVFGRAYGELKELLGVPGLLRMVRELIAIERGAQGAAFRELTGIRTRCDLHFRYYWDQILGRDLLTSSPEFDRQSFERLWELMLATTAFRMVLGRHNDYSVPEGQCEKIKREVASYCEKFQPLPDGKQRPESFWDARWREIETFTTLSSHGVFEKLREDQRDKLLCWRHKSWMEFFCGVFLAKYAAPECLSAFPLDDLEIPPEINPEEPGFLQVDLKEHRRRASHKLLRAKNVLWDALAQVANDPAWTWAWRCAIDLPGIPNRFGRQFEPAVLTRSLAPLFDPQEKRGRRPTELMYRAWALFQTTGAGKPLRRKGDAVVRLYQSKFREILRTSDDPLPENVFSPIGVSSPDKIPASGRTKGQVAAQLVPAFRVKQLLASGEFSHERWTSIAPPSELPEFVLCPPDGRPATFWQGSAAGVGYASERPRHPVRVAAFWMQATAVTVEQYCGLFDPGLYREHGSDIKRRSPTADSPIVMVDWYDTLCFALWIGAQLPSETQWEFACRAGHDKPEDLYGIEDSPGRYDRLSSSNARFNQNSYSGTTAPVRQLRRNEWGLYQMHGNVWEWTRDTNESYTERWERVSKALRKVEVIDLDRLLSGLSDDEWADVEELQFVPTAGLVRVLRGGSWYDNADYCRAARRFNFHPAGRFAYYGFRVVCVG